uniref:PAZ domain-containing protein n=1 Tax=Panagrolaimus superbus TaxID=310955 RepID=A0A914Y3A2_9BILA
MVETASDIINLGNRTLSNLEIDHLKTAFIGLSAQTRHETPPRTITIHSISTESADSKMIAMPDGDKSVAAYFLERYGIRIQYPKVNLVIESGPQKSEFPMELLQICDNQRVRTEHQTPELVQNMIRACAVPPSTLIPQNLRNGRALGLFGENRSPHLAAMDIDVVGTPVTVNTRVLPPPYIQYRNNSTATPEPARATWTQRAYYLLPCDLGKWAVYILGSAPRNRSRFEQQELQQFLSCFQQQCGKVGVNYVAPAYMSAIPIDVGKVEEEFAECKRAGINFMFFIHADNDQSLHKVVKLLERQYEIVTQLVKMQNAGDIVSKGKQQTMENIIHKTK